MEEHLTLRKQAIQELCGLNTRFNDIQVDCRCSLITMRAWYCAFLRCLTSLEGKSTAMFAEY